MNVAVRFALLCLATTGVVLTFVQIYQLPVDTGAVTRWTVFASLLFNVLFVFLRLRYAFPIIGLGFYLSSADFFFNLGCLADYMLITVDGGMLATARYSSRSELVVLHRMTLEFMEGLQSAVIFFAFVFALIFALAGRGKFIGSILITVIIMLVPAIASQKATFVPAMVILLVGMLGLYSMWASQEQSFLKSVRAGNKKKWPMVPQIHRHSVNGAATAILALVACLTAQSFLPAHKSRDIIEFWVDMTDDVLERLVNIGDFIGGGFGAINIPMLDTSGYMPSGGINVSGSLSLNNPNTSRREVLIATFDDNDNPIYLRNGIGANFNPEKGEWDVPSKANSMVGFPDNFYPEHEYLVFRQKIGAFDDFNVESMLGRQQVDIEYLVRTPHVMLPTSPYIPDYKSDSRFNWRSDAIIEKRGSNRPESYSWDILYPIRSGGSAGFSRAIDAVQNQITSERAMTASEASIYNPAGRFEDYVMLEFNSMEPGVLRIFVSDYDLTTAEYLRYLAEYEEMVYDIYTRTTPSESENMRAMNEEIFGNDPLRSSIDVIYPRSEEYIIAESIEFYFKHNYTYSLTVDNNAGENTALGNFLFETKASHCAYYATAMTLMLREMDIPARFVTGYVAGNGSGTPISGRYTHTILERDLHAWVEVYFKGVGWLPFDPTPPIFEYHYLEAERVHGGATTTTTPRVTPPRETTTPPPRTTPPDRTTPEPTTTTPGSENPQDVTQMTSPPPHKFSNTALTLQILIIGFAAFLTGIIALSVITFFKGLTRTEKKKLARYADMSERNIARESYRFILKLLRMEGLAGQPGETPVKFAERVDEAVQGYGLTTVIEAIEKLEFSREELTAEEYKRLSDTATGLYGQIVTEQKKLKRLARRIIVLGIIK